MRTMPRILLPVVAIVLLGGCVYGPDYGYVRGDGYYGDAYYGTPYVSGPGYGYYDPGYYYGFGSGYYYGPSVGFYYGHHYRRGPWRGHGRWNGHGGWNGGHHYSGGGRGRVLSSGSHVRSGGPPISHSHSSRRH